MLLISDKLDEFNPIVIVMYIISLIGLYDITQEMIEDNVNILSKNMVKKLILFSVIYLKSQSIFTASIVSIITMLLFDKVFFGEQTTSRNLAK